MISKEVFFGGAQYRTLFAGSYKLTNIRDVLGRVKILNPDENNVEAQLPDATTLRLGGPHIYAVNTHATFNIIIKDFNQTNTIVTLAGEKAAVFVLLAQDDADGTWLYKTFDLL